MEEQLLDSRQDSKKKKRFVKDRVVLVLIGIIIIVALQCLIIFLNSPRIAFVFVSIGYASVFIFGISLVFLLRGANRYWLLFSTLSSVFAIYLVLENYSTIRQLISNGIFVTIYSILLNGFIFSRILNEIRNRDKKDDSIDDIILDK